MLTRLDAVHQTRAEIVATARLAVETPGRGFVEITRDVETFIGQVAAHEGIVWLYLRHTSASLVIQENADPDVQADLTTALDRLVPERGDFTHDSEGPDDMPAHVKAMLTGVSLHVPVIDGSLALGSWQGIYVAEHRARPHRRDVVLQFIGAGRDRR